MALFNIRPASTAASDPELFIDLMDSQISWLSSIGSSNQWGSEPVREARPNDLLRAREWIRQSEQRNEWGPSWLQAFVAEVPKSSDDDTWTSAAAMALQSKSASYVRDFLPEQDEADPFVYVAYLTSNRKIGAASKGAGAALLELAKEQARKAGVRRLCLDCFAGNDRKLVRYYENQGFKVIGEFVAPVRDWPCAVLEMRL